MAWWLLSSLLRFPIMSRTTGALEICGTHGEKNSKSHVFWSEWSPVRSRCRCSMFSQAWMACERSSICAAFSGDKICLLSSRLLPAANGSHTKQPVFAIVPDLVPVQLHGQPPELLLQSLRLRNVAILDPSRSSRQSPVGDVSRRSAVSGFPSSLSPATALCALRRRSLLPSTTRFSNLGHSSSRTDLASNSSVPPTGRETTYPSDRGEDSCPEGSKEVLREPLGVQLTLAGWSVPRTRHRAGWDLLR